MDDLTPTVIFEDEHFLALNKPPGWVVNDADTTKNLKTVQGYLAKNFDYEISQNLDLRSGIVHRLDKDTSGVLLVAKTEKSFYELQRQFKERLVEKTYVALVHGELVEDGEVDAPTGRLPWNKRKFGVLPGGRQALTRYKVVKLYDIESRLEKKLTFLELYPKTGRTHQIRIHMKYLNHPLVCDRTYAGRKNWRYDHKWCPRIFLHAKEISFLHPVSGEKINYKAELPEDLKTALLNIPSSS